MNDDDEVHITCKDMLGPSERTILQHFLGQQRAAVLAIIGGLTEEQLRRPVLPSGWTPIGMIKHLGGAELHWIQQVFKGEDGVYAWPDGIDEPYDPDAPFTTDHDTTAVIDYYRHQAAVTDETLAAAEDLYAWPHAPERHPEPDEPAMQLRWIILHLIEETARHAGHLDAARELLDGRTGLGPR
jgi:hypothetical protein